MLLLLLSIFLLSSCFSGSMGNATEEFKENFKAVVALASEEVSPYLSVFMLCSSFDGSVTRCRGRLQRSCVRPVFGLLRCWRHCLSAAPQKLPLFPQRKFRNRKPDEDDR